MGFFSKAKKAAQDAAQQAQQAMNQGGQPPQGQAGDGYVHVQGAGPVDPAAFGGPSTAPVAENDPIWEPINGISLQDYADLAKDCQARGVNDEAGMITVAQEKGWDPADTKAALDGWVARMGQSQAVGQQFRRFLGY
ncbi:hypothetical protein HNR19_000699 [Nocardioides thalensis]|uniref:Uncharacterized protein n=1 Tax=Nocardioides thalensis TaxID=1914755 RepID=A0A853BYH1_9ACTN|nr:hypothetical protein [Nocardioides thalensis]NYJ00001.1 hypothetical protein [Nocardioides thalensis]